MNFRKAHSLTSPLMLLPLELYEGTNLLPDFEFVRALNSVSLIPPYLFLLFSYWGVSPVLTRFFRDINLMVRLVRSGG